MENNESARLARVEEKVDHIQDQLLDLKGDLKNIMLKMDNLSAHAWRLQELEKSVVLLSAVAANTPWKLLKLLAVVSAISSSVTLTITHFLA